MTTDIRRLPATRLAGCLGAALGMTIGNAHGSTPVTSCADDGSPGTLRAVLSAAANNSVIDLSGCGAITLTQGEIPIPVSVTLQGSAQGTTAIDANQNGRAFHSTSASPDFDKLDLVALTLTGGFVSTDVSTASGGCILGGEVTLQDTVVTGCAASASFATAEGGAISANTVTLKNSRVELGAAMVAVGGTAIGGGIFAATQFKCYGSSVSTNEAVAAISQGGGVAVGSGSALLSGCTLDSNFSQYAAGLIQSGSIDDRVSITNSTISSNDATVANGGVSTQSPLTLKNSTVAYNFSAGGCGGVRSVGDIALDSSIVAGNFSGNAGCVDLDSDGTISGTNNLVSVATAKVPADTIVANARLTALADHGGPTHTHGLSLNSPAVDHGSNIDSLASDQRGGAFARVVGAAADIGAFERQAGDDELFYGSSQ